jgi:hypothetical protein
MRTPDPTMLTCVARFVACALVAGVVRAGVAGAQTPTASPAPAPTALAFSAHAHANLTVVAQGNTYNGSVELAVAQRANLMRFDVLSVKSDTFPVPPISLTFVIDRRANTLTAWSAATKQYRVQPLVPRAAASATPRASAGPRARTTPRPTATPGPQQRGTSPFAKLDVLEATLRLTGHTTTAGLPTTGLAFDLQVRKTGESATSHVSATTQLADEFAAFPVTLDASLEPGAVPFSAKLSYAVDELTRAAPPLTRFTVPAGYTEARSMLNVIFPGGPMSLPAPARPASPQPTASP